MAGFLISTDVMGAPQICFSVSNLSNILKSYPTTSGSAQIALEVPEIETTQIILKKIFQLRKKIRREKIKFLTELLSQASIKLKVPMMLFLKYLMGFFSASVTFNDAAR